MPGLLHFLIFLLVNVVVLGLVFWLIWWVIGAINPPEPFNKVIRVIFALIVAVALISILLGWTPGIRVPGGY